MSGTFPNRLPGSFAAEVVEANNAAANDTPEAYGYENGKGPFTASCGRDKTGKASWAATAGFIAMVGNSNIGRKFKWTLNTRGDLSVISPQLKHAVASGGGDVLTAGHGWLSGVTIDKRPQVALNNDTGHYWTTTPSLTVAVSAWQSLGYDVKTVAFVDPKTALNKLF